jgi:hypothetical protein
MNDNRIRVTLLIDKAGSYYRGLIKGIIHYASLSSPWDFFLEGPVFTVADEHKSRLKKLKLWRPDCIIMNESFYTPDFTTSGKGIIIRALISWSNHIKSILSI